MSFAELRQITLDQWLRIVSAASTFAIGIAASFLAYQQFRISKSKLRFDLYEKRLGLFESVRSFASGVALTGEVDAGQLYRETIERYFLFDEDVCAYIDDMYERAKRLERMKLDLSAPTLNEDERKALIKALVETKSWFFDQSSDMLQVFSKDLSIRTLR